MRATTGTEPRHDSARIGEPTAPREARPAARRHDTRPRAPRRHGGGLRLATVAAVAGAAYALPVLLVPTNFIQDDSYFYLQIARNVAEGLGSTFHTITPTNGYHPLWLALLSLVFWTTGAEGAAAMRVAFALQVGIGVAALLLFRQVALRLGLRSWPLGAALLAGFLLSTTLYGSEAHLGALMLAAGLWAVLVAMERGELRAWMAAGGLLGLAVLARLDHIFVAACLPVAAAVASPRGPWGDRVNRILAAGVATGAVIAPYLLLNAVQFGHVMPISGAIKSTFPHVTGRWDALGDLGQLTALAGAVSLAAAFRPRLSPARRAALGGLGAGVLLHAAYVVLYTDHYTFWRWYYVAGVLDIALLGTVVLDGARDAVRRRGRGPWGARASAAATGLLVAAGLGYGWLKALDADSVGPWRLPGPVNEFRWPDEFGAWMRERLPNGSGVLVHDYPGALAWHSGLRILPTDGLINDFAYNDEILAEGIESWLCEKRVGFFLGPLVSEPAVLGPRGEIEMLPRLEGERSIRVNAPLYRRPAGIVRVTDRDLIVRVPAVVSAPERTPDVGLWRLSGPCFP